MNREINQQQMGVSTVVSEWNDGIDEKVMAVCETHCQIHPTRRNITKQAALLCTVAMFSWQDYANIIHLFCPEIY